VDSVDFIAFSLLPLLAFAITSELAWHLQKEITRKRINEVRKMKDLEIHKKDKQLHARIKMAKYLDRNQIKKRVSDKSPNGIKVGMRLSKVGGFELSKRIALQITKNLKVMKQHIEEKVRMHGG
jgi:hypothetical protein